MSDAQPLASALASAFSGGFSGLAGGPAAQRRALPELAARRREPQAAV